MKLTFKDIFPNARYNIKLDLNHLKEYKALTDKEYGLFAVASYHQNQKGYSINNIKLNTKYLDKNAAIYQSIYGNNIVIDATNNGGYNGQGVLRLSKKTTSTGKQLIVEVLILHRGTDSLLDMLTTWPSIIMAGKTSYFSTASYFTIQILEGLGIYKREIIRNNNFSDIIIHKTHVGHSLGGSLAVMVGTRFGHKTVAFEAPDVGYQKNKISQFFKKKNKSIKIFNMVDSIVSLPRTNFVKPRTCFANSYGASIRKRHSMDRMITKCFDAQGDFIDGNIGEIEEARQQYLDRIQLSNDLLHRRF